MPGYVIEIGPKGKTIARCTLRTPGRWENLSDREKYLWNKATHAINELFELYDDGEIRS